MEGEQGAAKAAPAQPPPARPPPLPPMRRRALRLDRVVGSQPELGPAAPDGGVGWLVVAASALLRVSLPTLALSYGAVVVRDAAAGDPPVALPAAGATTWNGEPLWVPALFSAAWSFAAPWSRTLATAKGARAACAIGAVLAASAHAAAALLAATHSPAHAYLVGVSAGVLAGTGCCLALSAGDYLLRAYFRTQLLRAQALVRAAQAVGSMLAPLVLYGALERWGSWRAQMAQATLAAIVGLLAAATMAPPRYVDVPVEPITPLGPLGPLQGYKLLEEEPEAQWARVERLGVEEPEAGPSGLQKKGGPGPRLDPDSDVELLPMPSSSSEDEDDKERPLPLFSDVELRSGAAAVFMDDAAAEEEVVLFTLDSSRPKGRYRLGDELRMLTRPMLYTALTVCAAGRLSSLAYWLLGPALAWARADRLNDLQALGLLSLGGVADFAMAWGWPWLRPLSSRRRAVALVLAAVSTTLGFFGLGSGTRQRSLPWLLVSALASRAGLALGAALTRPLLLDALGADDFAHAISLLDTLTGLVMLLATLAVGPSYAGVFWALGWFNLVSGLAVALLYYSAVLRRRLGGR